MLNCEHHGPFAGDFCGACRAGTHPLPAGTDTPSTSASGARLHCETHGFFEGDFCGACRVGAAPPSASATLRPLEAAPSIASVSRPDPGAAPPSEPVPTIPQLLYHGLGLLERCATALEHTALGEAGRTLLQVRGLLSDFLPQLGQVPLSPEARELLREACIALNLPAPAQPAQTEGKGNVISLGADPELAAAREAAAREAAEAQRAQAHLAELEKRAAHAPEGAVPVARPPESKN